MPTYFPYLFFHLELVWGGIDRNVPRKAAADPAGLRSLRPSRPRPSGAVQRPGTCTADASWHSSAPCTVVALKGKAKHKAVFSSLPCLLPADTYDVLAGSFLMRLALLILL